MATAEAVSMPAMPALQCPIVDDPNHLVMLPYPQDCRKYYTCSNGQAFERQCPDNLYWSQLTYRCDYKPYSNCNNYEPSNSGILYNTVPGDCTHYYETRLLSCPTNYHWNNRNNRCDPPQLAGCELSPLPTLAPFNPIAPTAATPPTPNYQPTILPNYNIHSDLNMICQSNAAAKYLPHPENCQKFIQCGPQALELSCPQGLSWNANVLRCDASNINCRL